MCGDVRVCMCGDVRVCMCGDVRVCMCIYSHKVHFPRPFQGGRGLPYEALD